MINYSIMSTTPDELYHHGVQGMKWGVRRFQNKDGSLTAAGKKRYDSGDFKKNYDEKKAAYKNAKKEYNKSFNKAYNRSGIHITKKGREEDQKRWEDSYDKLKKMESAKADYKNAKTAMNKNSVANYNKDYERSIKSQDKADAEWAKVKSMYKDLGKTPFERIKNASSAKTASAKAYLKAYDKAEKLQDKADADWAKANDSYIKTGKNSVSRLINNILYDSVRDTSGQTIRDHIQK